MKSAPTKNLIVNSDSQVFKVKTSNLAINIVPLVANSLLIHFRAHNSTLLSLFPDSCILNQLDRNDHHHPHHHHSTCSTLGHLFRRFHSSSLH